MGSFSVITEFLMGFLGSVLAGHFLGEDALAGVSLLSPVFTAVIFVSGLFGVGMGVNYARALGACDRRRAHEIFSQGLWSVLAVGAAMALAMAFGREAFLRFMDPSPAVADYARAYWRWFVPVTVLEPLAVFFLNCCYADGDDRQCYGVYAVQLVLNLGVAALLLRAGYGTAGCAAGALAGFAGAVAVLAFHFRKPSNSFRLVRHFCLADTVAIVRSSFGDASGFLCNAILFFLLGKVFLAKFDAGLLPVLSVVIATLGLLEVFNGVGVAAQPVVSVYVGEDNVRGVRRVMSAAIRLSVWEGLAASVLLAVLPQSVVALLGVADPRLAALSCRAVRMLSVGFAFTAVANLLNGYYILIAREGLAVGFTFWKWLVAPLALVFALLPLGMDGVWAALGFAPGLAMALFWAYVRVRDGRGMFPFLLPAADGEAIRMFDLALDEKSIVAVSEAVGVAVSASGAPDAKVIRARLMTEEVLMTVRDRNAGRRVLAEVTLDMRAGVQLTLRDDGEIFDITDADAKVNSLRTFLVASVMERQKVKMNLITTGFNRNVFRF